MRKILSGNALREVWRIRNALVRKLSGILGVKETRPGKLRELARDILRQQTDSDTVDPVLAYLFRKYLLVRDRLFEHYRLYFSGTFEEARRIHEEGESILAEELLRALETAGPETDDAGFKAYFEGYRLRAFSRIVDLIEDRGVYVPPSVAARIRAIKRELARFYTASGRLPRPEELEGEELSGIEKMWSLITAARVELYEEGEDGVSVERAVDHMDPETVLLIREEALKKGGVVRPSPRRGGDPTTTARLFWWNWSQKGVSERISSEKRRSSEASTSRTLGTRGT